MQRILAFFLSILLIAGAAGGCADRDAPSQPASTTSPALKASLEEILSGIYEKHPMELTLETTEVDLSDNYSVKSYLGLDNGDAIKEAIASESGFGAQAYSLVLCRLKDSADAAVIARKMADGIDQRKWVCVEADDLMVSACGDVVMLIMISSQYADEATAQSLTDAFAKVCGGSLTLQIR